METSLKTDFAQIFSRCPKNLSCPKFGGTAAPLAPPARTPTATYECDEFQSRIRTPCPRLSVIDFNSYVVHVIIIRTLTPAWWNNLPPEIIASTSLLRTFRQSLCNLTY